jgi:hypothetical protein
MFTLRGGLDEAHIHTAILVITFHLSSSISIHQAQHLRVFINIRRLVDCVLTSQKRLPAVRARDVVPVELAPVYPALQAVPVEHVATQNRRARPTTVREVFEAHRTLLLFLLLDLQSSPSLRILTLHCLLKTFDGTA